MTGACPDKSIVVESRKIGQVCDYRSRGKKIRNGNFAGDGHVLLCCRLSGCNRCINRLMRRWLKHCLRDEGPPMSGNPQAKVTLVIFLDYQSGRSIVTHGVLDALLGMIRIFVLFIVIFLLLNPVFPAGVAGCAGCSEAKRYLEVHRALMRAAARNQLSKDKIFAIAKAAGLNIRHLSKEMYQPAIEEAL